MKPIKPFAIAVSTILTLVLTLGMLFVPTAEAWASDDVPLRKTITILGSGEPTPPCPEGDICKRFDLLDDPADPHEEIVSYFLDIEKRNKKQEQKIGIVTPTVNEFEACLAAYTGGFFFGRIEFPSDPNKVDCVPGSASPGPSTRNLTKCNIKVSGNTIAGDLYQSTTPVCEEI